MGGGRYDNLVAQLGGPNLPSVGFACGMERLILSIEQADASDTTVLDAFYRDVRR